MKRIYRCPYCQFDMSDAHTEIVAMGAERPDDDMTTLCVECGEPIFINAKQPKDGWRKPTWEELTELVTDVRYHNARAGWLELKARMKAAQAMPVEEMYLRFKRHYLADFQPPTKEAERSLKMVYFIAFSQAVKVMSDIFDEEDDAAARVHYALIKAELNAFYELNVSNRSRKDN